MIKNKTVAGAKTFHWHGTRYKFKKIISPWEPEASAGAEKNFGKANGLSRIDIVVSGIRA
jgi:hypothetical protein